MGPVLALSTILVGSVIVAESTLTFLGVGLEAPSISWGLQLASAQAQFDNYPAHAGVPQRVPHRDRPEFDRARRSAAGRSQPAHPLTIDHDNDKDRHAERYRFRRYH